MPVVNVMCELLVLIHQSYLKFFLDLSADGHYAYLQRATERGVVFPRVMTMALEMQQGKTGDESNVVDCSCCEYFSMFIGILERK
jgi:hypothetical protein